MMTVVQATDLLRDAMMVTLVIIGPILGIGMVVGLVISLVQAVTQIQEQTLSFAPKVVIVFGVLALAGSWIGTQLLRFTFHVFDRFPYLIHQ